MAFRAENPPARLGLCVSILIAALILTPSTAAGQSVGYPKSVPTPLAPMPADANPGFEVATIKPSDTSAPHGTFIHHNGRQIIAYNMSVGQLITYAYSLHAKQITGGPASLLATHFDIDGVPDIDGHANIQQTRSMFQKLLVSRFRLVFHYESRELPLFAIQVGKGGPHLSPTASKPGDSTEFTYTCQAVLTVRNYSVADVAKGMQDVFLDKPVVDQTGLRDRYNFDLKWTPDDSQTYCPSNAARSRDDPNAPPGLYTAIQEQLGLKIVPTRAPVQVMVIDHVEKPSEN